MTAKLAALPGAPCSPYIREYRHDCAAHGGVSWPLRLREHTLESPDGLFAYTWLEATCGCGLHVRSSGGRFAVHG